MQEKHVFQTLEEKFIEESIVFFKEQKWNVVEEINSIIVLISSNIMLILRTSLSFEQKEEMLLDLADFIPSKFKNNPQFSNLLDKYISEKIKIIQTLTKKNTKNLLNKNPENIWTFENNDIIEEKFDNKDKTEKILNLLQKIQEKTDTNGYNSREELIIIQEILWLFDKSYENFILGNIFYIYERVEDIINSDLLYFEKINEFKKSFDILQSTFFTNNKTATNLLRNLVKIKIKKYLISVNKKSNKI